MNIRDRIVAEAMSWLRTPYHHEAMVKGGGVDCAMILIAVYSAVGLIEPFRPDAYPSDWMLHRNEERYLKTVLAHAHEVETPLPGDVLLFRYGRCFSHSVIVTDFPIGVHAYKKAGMVTLTDVTNEPLNGREFKAFSVL